MVNSPFEVNCNTVQTKSIDAPLIFEDFENVENTSKNADIRVEGNQKNSIITGVVFVLEHVIIGCGKNPEIGRIQSINATWKLRKNKKKGTEKFLHSSFNMCSMLRDDVG